MTDKSSKQASHTPGPWRADHKAHCRVLAGENDTVATTGCQSDLIDQWEANACLIAAAPTMFSYIEKRAAAGDVEAVAILEEINGTA